jgi:DNA-binding PadR family transcriptional regulator
MGLRRRLTRAYLGPAGRFFGPGELRLALLSLLQEAPSNGYQLMSRLEERCGGAYQASAGAIYPTLAQLEDEKLIATQGAENRTYTVTKSGKEAIRAHREEIDRVWARASSWSDWGAFRDPDAAEIVGPALRLAKAALKAVAHAHGDPAVIDSVRVILEEARGQIERLEGRKKR